MRVAFVFTGGLGLEGLFLVNGNAERVEWLRQRYDSGEEVNLEKEADLASAVSLLRLFLQELPEPIIPDDLQKHIQHLYQGEYMFLMPFLINLVFLDYFVKLDKYSTLSHITYTHTCNCTYWHFLCVVASFLISRPCL